MDDFTVALFKKEIEYHFYVSTRYSISMFPDAAPIIDLMITIVTMASEMAVNVFLCLIVIKAT